MKNKIILSFIILFSVMLYADYIETKIFKIYIDKETLDMQIYTKFKHNTGEKIYTKVMNSGNRQKSYTTLKIEERLIVMEKEKPVSVKVDNKSKKIVIEWLIEGIIKVTYTVGIIPSVITGRRDKVYFEYIISNDSDRTFDLGLRKIIDTSSELKKIPIIETNTKRIISPGTKFNNITLPEYFIIYNDPDNIYNQLRLAFTGFENFKPGLVVYDELKNFIAHDWEIKPNFDDITVKTLDSLTKNAFALVYDGLKIEANGSLSLKFYYGLNQKTDILKPDKYYFDFQADEIVYNKDISLFLKIKNLSLKKMENIIAYIDTKNDKDLYLLNKNFNSKKIDNVFGYQEKTFHWRLRYDMEISGVKKVVVKIFGKWNNRPIKTEIERGFFIMPPVINIQEVAFKEDNLYVVAPPNKQYSIEDLGFIITTGFDMNAYMRDDISVNVVKVRDNKERESLRVPLLESGYNTGRYVGVFRISDDTSSDVETLTARDGDKLNIQSRLTTLTDTVEVVGDKEYKPKPEEKKKDKLDKSFVRVISVEHLGVDRPWYYDTLAKDDEGFLYYINTYEKKIVKLNSEYKKVYEKDLSFIDEKILPYAIDFDSYKNIYITDIFNNCFYKLNKNWELVKKAGGPGSDDGKFYGPYDIKCDIRDKIYVVDTFNSRIQIFDEKLNFIKTFGSPGYGKYKFLYPKAISVNKGLIVVDTNNNRLVRYTDRLKYAGEISKLIGDETPLYKPIDIETDQKFDIYIADSRNNRVVKSSIDGYFLGEVKEEEQEKIKLIGVHSITMDINNNLNCIITQ